MPSGSPAPSPTPGGSVSALPCLGVIDIGGEADITPVATDAIVSPEDPSSAAGSRTTASSRTGRIRVRRNVPFMERQACAESRTGCVNLADIYYPSKAGPWPVIVTIHGRPRYPDDMVELAEALAAKGAVVLNVDYRGVRPGFAKGFPQSISDVACAVRYARQHAARYGGDRHHVVLVGHSMGGYVGAMVALAGDTFPSAGDSCRSTLGMKASLPNGFVSVAGVSAVHTDYRIDQAFFGANYAQSPGVWKRGSLHSHIGRRIGRNHRLKVGIIFERQDPFMEIGHATHLDAALDAAGYDSDLVLLSRGTTHFDILDTDRAIGRRVIQLVWHIVDESDPHD